MFDPGAGYEQKDENDDEPLFRLRENEKVEKGFHCRA